MTNPGMDVVRTTQEQLSTNPGMDVVRTTQEQLSAHPVGEALYGFNLAKRPSKKRAYIEIHLHRKVRFIKAE